MTVPMTDSLPHAPTGGPIARHIASEARLLANVQARAKRLFEDGYVARRIALHRIRITAPSGTTYELNGANRSCTCPFFTRNQGRYACKHLLGAACLLKKQAAILRHNALTWEAMA